MPERRLSESQAACMARRYEEGEPIDMLQHEFGIGKCAFYRYLDNAGVERRGRGGPRISRRPRPRIALPPDQRPRRREPDPITGDTIARVTWLHKVQGLSSLRIAPLVRLPYREVERIIGAGA